MEVRLTLQELNGFPRVSRHGHRGGPVDNGQNGRKWVAAVIW